MKLPEWMSDAFEKGQCPYCKKPLSEKGVTTHGIREERSKSKNKIRYAHFYDYKCPKCKNRSIFSFPTTFKEFITDMLELSNTEMPNQLSSDHESNNEENTDQPTDQPPEPKKKSGISDDEVLDAKKSLDEAKDLKDFFDKIGIDISRIQSDKKDENK